MLLVSALSTLGGAIYPVPVFGEEDKKLGKMPPGRLMYSFMTPREMEVSHYPGTKRG